MILNTAKKANCSSDFITYISPQYRLFEKDPSLQNMFSEFRELKLEELKRTRELHGHTERVMRAVENSVNAMDDPDSLRAYLTELGRRHVYRSAKPSVGNVSSQCRYHGTECRNHS